MKTLSKTMTARFFRSPEDYERLMALWSCAMQDKDARRQLTAAHHLLYLILRGRDWHGAFTPVTNARKLENGGFFQWKARFAVTTLHRAGMEAKLLAPFRDVLAPDALRLIRELVPALSWDGNPLEGEPYHA